MSRYTTELRYILENPEWTDERLGLTQYQIFDEGYRDRLNTLIKDHFYFDEIGQETPARFAHRLRHKLNLIMPFFNQLYKSAALEINPMLTMDYDIKLDSTLAEILNAVKNGSKAGKTAIDNVNGSIDSNHSQDGGEDVTKNKGEKSGNDSVTDNSVKQETGTDGTDLKHNTRTSDNSLSVTSDTPEGFVLTNSIEHSTYANTGTKTEANGSTTGDDTTTTNYAHANFDTATKNRTYSDDDSSTTTTTYGKSNDNVNNHTGNSSTDSIIDEIVNELNDQFKNATTDALTHYKGYNGKTMSQMLNEWRATFLNIDQMVLDELEDLFMGVLN